MHVDRDGFPDAGRAGVGARVRWPGVLHHQEAGRHVALLRDDADATSRRIVGDDLETNSC